MQNKIEDIEWLRAVAILLVVIHHANINLFVWSTPALERFYTYFGGLVGVDLFFAISGFVIARDLLPRLEHAATDESVSREVIAFWLRRAWRLLPSAWVWLAIIMFLVVFFNASGAFGSFRANFEATVAAVLQVANFRLAEAFGHFEYGASSVYWSLSLEEQFYLVFPIIAIVFRKYLFFVVAAFALWQLFSVRSGLDMFALCFRTDALCLGILLAIASHKSSYALVDPTFLKWRLAAAGLMLVLLLCLLALGSNSLHVVNVRFSLIAIISAVLVWVASYNAGYWVSAFPLLRIPMLWLGSRSYAIYLIHMPVFYFTRELWFRTDAATQGFNDDFFFPFVITACLLIVVLSELNYRLLEVPLRDHGKKVARRIRGERDSVVDMSEPVRSQ